MGLELKLRGQRWKVEFPQKVLDEDGSQLDGRCDYDKNKIEIARYVTTQRKGLILTHEALHVAMEGLTQSSKREEDIIRFIEGTVYELICSFPARYKQ